MRNELKQNIKSFQELAKSHPSCSWFQQRLGSALAEDGVLDQAEAYYYKAIDINPNSSVSLYKLSVVLLQENKLDEAISCLNKAIKNKPDFYKLYNSLGQALEQQGNLDEAINCWQKAIALNPKSCWAYHYLGGAFSSREEWEKAIAYYQKAIKLNPRYFWSNYNLGQTFVNSGQPDLAIPCYRYGINIDPNYVWSYQKLANLLKDKGEKEEAVTCYQKAIKLNPNEVWFYNDLGQILVQQGQIDEAIECYQKAIQINFQEPWLHNNLGLALVEKGNLEEAASCCRKAIELKPDDFWFYQNLADILTKKGDVDEAIACFEKALEIKPDAWLYHLLGNNYLRKQDWNQAISSYQKAINTNFDLFPSYIHLAEAYNPLVLHPQIDLQEHGNYIHSDSIKQIYQHLKAAINKDTINHNECVMLNFPDYWNIGDSMIWLGSVIHLTRTLEMFIKYTSSINNFSNDTLKEKLGDAPIFLQGGGNFGDLWPTHQLFREEIISQYHHVPIFVMPQSIYFENNTNLERAKRVFNSHPNLTLFCREEVSYKFAQQHFYNCQVILCPDAAFSLVNLLHISDVDSTGSILYLRRTDKEINQDFINKLESEDIGNIVVSDWNSMEVSYQNHLRNELLMVVGNSGLLKNKNSIYKNLSSTYKPEMNYFAWALTRIGIKQLIKHKSIVTNRLHCHILATLLNIPHVFIPNSYHKNRSFYETWTKDVPFCKFIQSSEEVKNAIEDIERKER